MILEGKSTKWIRNAIVGVLVIAASAAVSVIGQTVTVTSETRWHRSSVDNAYMNRHIAEVAEQYKEDAPIQRVGFYDIGYPMNDIEMRDMNGYAVLLVSALSQDADELPVKRAYVSVAGKEIELKLLKTISLKNTDLTSQTVKTFGQYRSDSLYLFPGKLRTQIGQVFIDFSKNKIGMKMTEFDGSTPDNLKHLHFINPINGKKFDDALTRFMRREYPGYLDK